MRTFTLVAGTLLLVAGVGALVNLNANQARRDQQPALPIFEPGPAEVVGSVSITNEPTVNAQQAGVWKVSLADQPIFGSPTPEFLVVGVTYAFTWPGAERTDGYRILVLGQNGWVGAQPLEAGAARWLNTSLAMTIEELQP